MDNRSHHLAKYYTFRHPDGRIIRVYNLSDFCRNHGLDRGGMGNVANGHRTSCQGWTLADDEAWDAYNDRHPML